MPSEYPPRHLNTHASSTPPRTIPVLITLSVCALPTLISSCVMSNYSMESFFDSTARQQTSKTFRVMCSALAGDGRLDRNKALLIIRVVKIYEWIGGWQSGCIGIIKIRFCWKFDSMQFFYLKFTLVRTSHF